MAVQDSSGQYVSTQLQRAFYFEQDGQEIRLADADNKLSPEAILNFYSNTYPQKQLTR